MAKPNAAPVGMAGFGLSLWMFGMAAAGWYAHVLGMVAALAFILAGVVMVIVGILEYVQGSTLGTISFLTYGAFWLSLAYLVRHHAGISTPVFGWFFLLWAALTFAFWLASLRRELVLVLFFLALWLTFLLLALGLLGLGSVLIQISGYTALIAALSVLYAASAQSIREGSEGLLVLPVGRHM